MASTSSLARATAGDDMHAFAAKLFPICRSITGNGVRETLAIIKRDIISDLAIHEVPSGTKCFDWEVPDEWNIRDAWLKGPAGDNVANFRDNNLHVVGYSVPIDERMPLARLRPHLHSNPEMPDAIPYVTSYYERRWGFCLRHAERSRLVDGEYHAFIDSTLEPGHLTYADLLIPGQSDREVLISTYVCHPSMANNELSGPVVAAFLARWIAGLPSRRLSYRFVFAPETIGAIVYLSRNLEHLKRHTVAGFNLTCIGDDRGYSYVSTRNGATLADRTVQHVMTHVAPAHIKYGWMDRGSDERQYGWPGVDLPVVAVMRSKFGAYPEYHTSLDDLSVVTPTGLAGGLAVLQRCIEALEANVVYRTPFLCEPQIGRRGLYRTLGVGSTGEAAQMRLDIMSCADGEHDLLQIADAIGRPVWDLLPYVRELVAHDLLQAGQVGAGSAPRDARG
jgi:aminopeptidase-like protein